MASIGIDLGYTNCRVAVVHNGKVKLLINKNGLHKTPAQISFRDNKVIIGEKKFGVYYPRETINDVKRVIGLQYLDVCNLCETNNFKFPNNIFNNFDKICFCITQNDKVKLYYPEEISGMLLKQLKEDAKRYLDLVINNVVIAVPAHFNDLQRKATLDAGKIAGFEQVNLINEPTAVAINYGIENKICDGSVILVFDFRLKTFDITILKYFNNSYKILAIDGDAYLGGEDFDNILTEFVINKSKLDESDKHYKRTKLSIKLLCKITKHELSTEHESFVDFMSSQKANLINITIDQFNDLTKEIIEKTMTITQRCIIENKIEKIDKLILIGGSSKIPKIREELVKQFGIEPCPITDAQEAIAYGAAIYAANLYNNQLPLFKKLEFNQSKYKLPKQTVFNLMKNNVASKVAKIEEFEKLKIKFKRDENDDIKKLLQSLVYSKENYDLLRNERNLNIIIEKIKKNSIKSNPKTAAQKEIAKGVADNAVNQNDKKIPNLKTLTINVNDNAISPIVHEKCTMSAANFENFRNTTHNDGMAEWVENLTFSEEPNLKTSKVNENEKAISQEVQNKRAMSETFENFQNTSDTTDDNISESLKNLNYSEENTEAQNENGILKTSEVNENGNTTSQNVQDQCAMSANFENFKNTMRTYNEDPEVAEWVENLDFSEKNYDLLIEKLTHCLSQ